MKKFEITQEQILELEKFGSLNKLKDWFPEAFKTELEVGKWYKNTQYNYVFCFNGVFEDWSQYGFNALNEWKTDLSSNERHLHLFSEASPQEVETALIAEAKKRYKIGDYVNGLYTNKMFCLNFESTGNGQKNIHVDNFYSVWMYAGNERNDKVFDNGQWATIVETITIQEAEKLLNKKIV